ncbi:MAG: di-heme oxidoredictase family protein, partial [bacterium]
MKHAASVVAVLAIVGVVVAAPACARRIEPGDPLGGLSRDERRRFERGKEVFERTFEPKTGLGPLFNADACGECHEEPATGGTGDEIEIHATALQPDGTCDPLIDQGGPVVQQQVTPELRAALGIEAEPVPAGATATGRRTSPDLFGFGLLDAVPEAEILARADPDDRDGDGVSGRPNRFVDGRLGRFGRKAFVPTLREFNDGAFNLEQGVTNPVTPGEETVAGQPVPEGVDLAADPEITQDDLDLTD